MAGLTHLLLVSQSVQHEQVLFDWTLMFAKQHHAKVTVLRVLPKMDHGLLDWFKEMVSDDMPAVTPDELMEKQRQEALTELKAWQVQAEQAGVVLEQRIEFGKVFYSAVQYVLNSSVDWLIKQTNVESDALKSHIFDSHDLHLLRKCPCPVLLHKHGARLPFKNVMACIDIDLDEDLTRANAFNQAILAAALKVVNRDNLYLEVLHAWQADSENLVRYWNTDLSESDLFKFAEKVRNQHLKAIEVEIEALGASSINIEPVLPKGEAEEVIPPIVELHQVDLLVMGTLGRNGLPGMIIGNTSESILEKVNCSVLALKPQNFVSPVKATD